MFKNKLVNIMLIIIIALTLIGVITVVLYNHFSANANGPDGEPTIDEIVALSVDTNEITTNLLTDDFIRIRFKIQVDNPDAKEELEKRDFQVESIIIRELSGMKSNDFSGPEGIENLENSITEKINEYMQEGTVVKIYTTGLVLQ